MSLPVLSYLWTFEKQYGHSLHQPASSFNQHLDILTGPLRVSHCFYFLCCDIKSHFEVSVIIWSEQLSIWVSALPSSMVNNL